MLRVRWCQLPILYVLLVRAAVAVATDCWYDDKRYQEREEVATQEPCLNCTCMRGTLVCYLRVCPRLPNPPPPGCILLHRYKTCCPELICTELTMDENTIEGRADPEGTDILVYDRPSMKNTCIANGTIYGPGSAMDSSTQCEYCYCLGGRQECVKPKCLLPLEGCTPVYETHSCCPVRYNCTRPALPSSTSTTTIAPQQLNKLPGCRVDGNFYPEGRKVLGMGHSACDNCYCLRGLLRCEPLSCAPPLLGCEPVVKQGECCAASYNCSGTIEIEPEPNYGEYPTVSKDYAKLRREFQQRKPTPKWAKKDNKATENSNSAFYVIAESPQIAGPVKTFRTPSNSGTTRHFTEGTLNPSTKNPNNIKDSQSSNSLRRSTATYDLYNQKELKSTTYKPNKHLQTPGNLLNSITTDKIQKQIADSVENWSSYSPGIFETIKTNTNVLRTNLDDREQNITEQENRTTSETTTETATVLPEDTSDNVTSESTKPSRLGDDSDYQTTPLVTVVTDLVTETTKIEEETATTLNFNTSTVVVKNSTDCVQGGYHLDPSNILADTLEKRHDLNVIESTTLLSVNANEINDLEEVTKFEYSSTEDSSELTSTEEDVTEVDLEFRVHVATPSIPVPSTTEAKNNTKTKEDNIDYDYNDLPPSLPNLRIIPFVAADALDTRKVTSENAGALAAPSEEATDSPIFNYGSLFSPPSKTEGGFVPKNPPILDNFYENTYITTGADVNVITPIPPRLNDEKDDEHGCLSEDKIVPHGEAMQSSIPCILCTCLYGSPVCHQTPCPLPGPGCIVAEMQEGSCCPQYECDANEDSSGERDRLDVPGIETMLMPPKTPETSDPFRDVIRTEPPPNFQSLIGDMPVLTSLNTLLPPLTQKVDFHKQNTRENTSMSYSNLLDRILELFPGEMNEETMVNSTKQVQNVGTTLTENVTTDEHYVASGGRLPNQKIDAADDEANKIELLEHDGGSTSGGNAPHGVGVLKLAGCNIYGRMYRVGRIISELSGPCMECKCTEIGVQCRNLIC